MKYFNSIGAGFYHPKPAYIDDKGKERRHDSFKSAFVPYTLLKDQLVEDMDSFLAANEERPECVMT